MSNTNPINSYASAGVDIDAADAAKKRIAEYVRATRRPEVLTELGGFSGMFAVNPLNLREPVLVSSIDGVGTKLKVAFAMKKFDTVGRDLVCHCVNDILTSGAKPLFFLDYLALGSMNPDDVAAVVSGVAQGCQQNGCALIGGETAQMPGFYVEGEFDLAGTIIGVAEKASIITGAAIQEGDVVIGLPSAGLHTNGYSLARKIYEQEDWTTFRSELGASIGETLLLPHISYLNPVMNILDNTEYHALVTGMAHITGGGLLDNIPRVIPAGLGVNLRAETWMIPTVFYDMQRRYSVSWTEMARVFNIGVGFVMIVRKDFAETAATIMQAADARVIGEVVSRDDGACVQIEGLG